MKILRETLIFLLLVSFVIYAAVVAYWLLYPYDIIVVESPIKVLNPGKTIAKGERLIYEVKWNKKLPYSGTLSRKLVNSFTFNYTDVQIAMPIGEDITAVSVLIPKFVPAGEYYLLWTATYDVNPMRKVSYQARSEIFYVYDRECLEGKH